MLSKNCWRTYQCRYQTIGQLEQLMTNYGYYKYYLGRISLLMKFSIYAIAYLCTYLRQFGYGISSMVGPKKQDFWPKINILKEIYYIFEWNEFTKKCQNLTFKVNVLFQESSEFFWFFSIMNDSSGEHFLPIQKKNL